MADFSPPPFHPDRWIRGGHLQTIASLRASPLQVPVDEQHLLRLPDDDALVLHESTATVGRANETATRKGVPRVLVLFHGLSGCHQSPYMVRLAGRFLDRGWTVYRVDMRGCGAAREHARHISHAGRSDDVAAALDFVADRHPDAALAAIGVSLGGNQLLRFAGRTGAGFDPPRPGFGQLKRLAVVAPPIDLIRCSNNMQRLSRRAYNFFFIRNLIRGAAPGIREHELFRKVASERRPKTLLQLDDWLTAPMSGFENAMDYYRRCGAASVVASNPISTLVLAAKDDPIVPVECFNHADWPASTRVLISPTGGHAGFFGRGKTYWMDECLVRWTDRL